MTAEIDPFLTALHASIATGDPSPAIGRLREEDPVHWFDALNLWAVTRHDDVKQLFGDPRVTADPRAWEGTRTSSDGNVRRWLTENPFLGESAGAPGKGRRLVSAALTPRAVARIEHQIREVVEQVAAPLYGRSGVVDLVSEFTAPIPGIVISRIAGVPAKGADEERFRVLARKTVRGVNPTLSDAKRESTEAAVREMFAYVGTLAALRMEDPRDDLISDLLQASGARSAEDLEEIVRVVAGLVSTGTEATVLAATRAIRSLLHHPDELALVRADRALLPDAVEELLRFDSGLSEMPRYALEDFTLRGRSIRKGQLLVLSLTGAHRDPSVFADPDRLDLRRRPKELVAFGHGPHYCIGAPLARVELQAMVGAALDFLPIGARVLDAQVRWSSQGLTHRIKTLPVEFSS